MILRYSFWNNCGPWWSQMTMERTRPCSHSEQRTSKQQEEAEKTWCQIHEVSCWGYMEKKRTWVVKWLKRLSASSLGFVQSNCMKFWYGTLIIIINSGIGRTSRVLLTCLFNSIRDGNWTPTLFSPDFSGHILQRTIEQCADLRCLVSGQKYRLPEIDRAASH